MKRGKRLSVLFHSWNLPLCFRWLQLLKSRPLRQHGVWKPSRSSLRELWMSFLDLKTKNWWRRSRHWALPIWTQTTERKWVHLSLCLIGKIYFCPDSSTILIITDYPRIYFFLSSVQPNSQFHGEYLFHSQGVSCAKCKLELGAWWVLQDKCMKWEIQRFGSY